jgi:hypothetical protein
VSALDKARGIVSVPLHKLFDERAAKRDWFGVLSLASSEERLSLTEALWSHLTEDERPGVFAAPISLGDAPMANRRFCLSALAQIVKSGHRVFDCAEAAARFDTLPRRVTIYRGTVDEEKGGAIGFCWTLSRDIAVWFATKHGRFHNRSSPPVLLAAAVPRTRVVGLLTGRKEDEVLIMPRSLSKYTRERLASQTEAEPAQGPP